LVEDLNGRYLNGHLPALASALIAQRISARHWLRLQTMAGWPARHWLRLQTMAGWPVRHWLRQQVVTRVLHALIAQRIPARYAF